MNDKLKEIRENSRIWTAWLLIVILVSFSVTTGSSISALASPVSSEILEDSLPAGYFSEQEDVWEELESGGEVLVAFPSQIEAAISSRDDEDRYSFQLEEESDLTLTMESEYPCARGR